MKLGRFDPIKSVMVLCMPVQHLSEGTVAVHISLATVELTLARVSDL